MLAFIAILGAFGVGLVVQLRYKRTIAAIGLSFIVVPAYVVSAEYLFPYIGGGASFFPIALIFGTVYGGIAGCIGVLIAVFILFLKTR